MHPSILNNPIHILVAQQHKGQFEEVLTKDTLAYGQSDLGSNPNLPTEKSSLNLWATVPQYEILSSNKIT